MLSTPLPDEKIRCVRNEKFKPIYIAGLVVALFEQIRITHGFKNRYLVEAMSDMFADPKASFMDIEQNSLSHEEMAAYREEVLKPVAKAALLLSIGSYSPQVEDIFCRRSLSFALTTRARIIGCYNQNTINGLFKTRYWHSTTTL